MRTAIYLRKSRAEETGDSVEETLRKHREILWAFAHDHHLSVEGVYEEVVSGDSLVSRPQMLQLLADVEAGRYQAVLCMDIDRLGRGAMSDQGVILETFKAAGVKIITPRKSYDLNNELDEEYTEFETFMARRELKLIKRRLQRGAQKSLEEGAFLCEPPYGYRRDTVGRRPTLAVVEEEAAFVRLMFQMYREGAGCQAIADAVNDMGARPRRAARFGRTSVARILKNPVYMGKVVWGRDAVIKKGGKRTAVHRPAQEWKVSDGLHPPLVDAEAFRQVQRIFESRGHPPYYRGRVENALAGLVRCAVCGQKLQRRPYGARGEADHLFCPTRGCCASTRMDRVEGALLDALQPVWEGLPLEKASGDEIRNMADKERIRRAAERELTMLQGQKGRLHDLLEQGVYTPADFLDRTVQLDARIRDAAAALQRVQEEMQRREKRARTERFGNVGEVYAAADPAERNRMLKSVVESAWYYKAKGWPPGRFILFVQLTDPNI